MEVTIEIAILRGHGEGSEVKFFGYRARPEESPIGTSMDGSPAEPPRAQDDLARDAGSFEPMVIQICLMQPGR